MYAGLVWHVVLYADGITPGAALTPENNRKSIVWYCSFLEMKNKLQCEEAWLTIAVARTFSLAPITCGYNRRPGTSVCVGLHAAVATAALQGVVNAAVTTAALRGGPQLQACERPGQHMSRRSMGVPKD